MRVVRFDGYNNQSVKTPYKAKNMVVTGTEGDLIGVEQNRSVEIAKALNLKVGDTVMMEQWDTKFGFEE